MSQPPQNNPHTVALLKAAKKYASHHCHLRFERDAKTPTFSSEVNTTLVFYQDGRHEFAFYRPSSNSSREWILVGEYTDIDRLSAMLLPYELTTLQRGSLQLLKVDESLPFIWNMGGKDLNCKIKRLKLPTLEVKAERGLIHNGRTSETETFTGLKNTPHQYQSVEYKGVYAPTAGIWSLRNAETPLYYYLDLFPDHASLEWHVHLETGPMSGPVVKAGIHQATLSLRARFQQGGKNREVNLLLDTQLTPHDPSRFGWESAQHHKNK